LSLIRTIRQDAHSNGTKNIDQLKHNTKNHSWGIDLVLCTTKD